MGITIGLIMGIITENQIIQQQDRRQDLIIFQLHLRFDLYLLQKYDLQHQQHVQRDQYHTLRQRPDRQIKLQDQQICVVLAINLIQDDLRKEIDRNKNYR
jgi:hypothetical protein